MDKCKVARINELAKKAKEGELTPEEITERASLRREYLDSVKANLRATLDNTMVENDKGEYESLKISNSDKAKKHNGSHNHGSACSCGCGGNNHSNGLKH